MNTLKELIINNDHIIWDWNGTLLDDASLCVNIMNRILNKHDLPELTLDFYRSKFGFPVKDYYKTIGFDFSKDSFEKISTMFIEEYEKQRGICKLHEFSIEILSVLKKWGKEQSVLSAYSQKPLEKIL
ncbi:MAG: HAD hydrolase-like protein, partial [Verrucomicrobiota bacterium]|nr:HAD hydrolase-like protein [Verrucomicrobiota bacterium]